MSKLVFGKVTYITVFLCWYIIWISCLASAWKNGWQVGAHFVVVKHSSRVDGWVSLFPPLPPLGGIHPTFSWQICFAISSVMLREQIVLVLESNRWTCLLQRLSRLWWESKNKLAPFFPAFKAMNWDIQCIPENGVLFKRNFYLCLHFFFN